MVELRLAIACVVIHPGQNPPREVLMTVNILPSICRLSTQVYTSRWFTCLLHVAQLHLLDGAPDIDSPSSARRQTSTSVSPQLSTPPHHLQDPTLTNRGASDAGVDGVKVYTVEI